jgi:hypothetical protein
MADLDWELFLFLVHIKSISEVCYFVNTFFTLAQYFFVDA